MADLSARVGAAVERDVLAALGRVADDPIAAGTISAQVAAQVVDRHGLVSTRELALLSLPIATRMARPPISGYRVGAVGIEARSGDLVLGGNLEFPGTDLQTTIHAEGFVSLRARRRGGVLETLAVREAHPCAHCRQTLAESIGADRLSIVDPLGHDLSLADLYPWSFRPAALGVAADDPGRGGTRTVRLEAADLPPYVAIALADAASRAHAPYSGCPSAVALRTGDGTVVSAGCVESVAFNPTITAAMAAFVELAAAEREPATVVEGWLARVPDGAVDPEPGFRALASVTSPGARLRVVDLQHSG